MENKVWDEQIIATCESHLIQAINKEILTQKEFEKLRDDRTDLGL